MARNFTDSFTTIVSSIRKLSFKTIVLVFVLGCPGLAASPNTVEIVGNPTVEDDEITVRINVRDEQNRPVVELLDTSFNLSVDNQDLRFESQNWKRPQDVLPPPAWIVVLLDMSGSMGKVDSKDTTKLQGALNAIAQFKDTIAERVADAPKENIPQIAIVPFGEPGENCNGYSVSKNELDKFFPANAYLLDNHLDFLSNQSPCASTNLYEPLSKAIRFLGNKEDSRFYPAEDSQSPQPRLSLILLSDGYHTEDNESKDFEELKLLIRQNPDIIIHTLGYGLTLEELGNKYGLGRPANRDDIYWSGPSNSSSNSKSKSLPKGKVPADEFVDQSRLMEIAQLTGGISEFSADAETVADKLQVFLNALLGEYQITYLQPNADRGSKHTVQASVTANEGSIQSALKTYIIPVFGRTLRRDIRIQIFVSTLLAMGIAGVIPFWFWANHLKEEEL